MSSIQYKFALSIKGTTYMYGSYDEAMKMAKFVGLSIKDIKELHIF